MVPADFLPLSRPYGGTKRSPVVPTLRKPRRVGSLGCSNASRRASPPNVNVRYGLFTAIDHCANVSGAPHGSLERRISPMKKLLPFAFVTASVAAYAGDERQPVFIKARCEGLNSMVVLSWITKSVTDSQKCRLVSSLDDGGNFGTVIHTIYMTCKENKDVTAIASSYGIAKCNSSKQCASVIDGESINVALCNITLSPDCGRALFKAFDA